MAGLNFNATEVEPQSDFSPIPQGKYLVMAVDSTLVRNKKNTGDLLKMTYEVVEPQEYRGRKIFDNINVKHDNSQAEQIGQRQLSSICHAVGVLNIQDSVELHNIPFVVDVIIDEQPGYSPKNEVKGYFDGKGDGPKSSGNAGAAPAAQPAAETQPQTGETPATAAPEKPPWQR